MTIPASLAKQSVDGLLGLRRSAAILACFPKCDVGTPGHLPALETLDNPGHDDPPPGDVPPANPPSTSTVGLPTPDMPRLDHRLLGHAPATAALPDMMQPSHASHSLAAHAPPLPFTQACHASDAGPAESLPATQAGSLSPRLGASHNAPTATLAPLDARASPVTLALHANISPPSSPLTASPGGRRGQAHDRSPSLPY